MTIARIIPAPTRAALLMAAGFVLMIAPLVLEMSGAAIATGVLLGVVTVGLGVSGTATEGRGTLPFSIHALYDRALAVGLIATALIFGATGEGAALVFFTAAGVATLVLALVTRYSATRAG
jgi:hypothetical protein